MAGYEDFTGLFNPKKPTSVLGRYVLVLEEGIEADLVSRADSELDKAQLASRLLRCVNALHEAGIMGRVFGSLFLLLLFFFLLLPLGLALRLFGKDLLQMRRWPSVARSYWKVPRPPGPLDRMH